MLQYVLCETSSSRRYSSGTQKYVVVLGGSVKNVAIFGDKCLFELSNTWQISGNSADKVLEGFSFYLLLVFDNFPQTFFFVHKCI